MNYRNLLYFDIETIGKYPTLEHFKSEDERGYNLFLRKIERKSEWKSENPDTIYYQKSSLVPEFGRIICASFAFYKNDEIRIKTLYDEFDEKILINQIQDLLIKISSSSTMGLCGYYIKGFDIPWLIRKMLKYDLKIPNIIRTYNIKPWDMNIFDLSDIWRGNGTLENVSFDEMLYDLGIDSPKSIISGEDINNIWWKESDINKIISYCEKDVKSCMKVAEKILINVTD